MTTGKTTKVVDKLVKAWNETIRERDAINKGWKLELIPVQHMFPNCQVKYKTQCKDMKSCDKDDQFERIRVEPDIKDKVEIKPIKPLKEFEDYYVWDGK